MYRAETKNGKTEFKKHGVQVTLEDQERSSRNKKDILSRAANRAKAVLDSLTKAKKESEKPKRQFKPWHQDNCGKWGKVAICEKGHKMAKILLCQKEFCVECGEDWSMAHKRRFARWLPWAYRMDSIGAWVITFPEDFRHNLRSAKKLREYRKKILTYFKDMGYDVGLCRLHYFGEKIKLINGKNNIKIIHASDIKNTEFENTIEYAENYCKNNKGWKYKAVFNPHFNILIRERYLKPDAIEKIKRDIFNILDIPFNKQNAHYRYYKSIPDKIHILKYVTRATFKKINWDLELPEILFNFRNAIKWGNNKKWFKYPETWQLKKKDQEEFEEYIKFDAKICPICDGKLKWEEKIKSITDLAKDFIWFDRNLGIMVCYDFFKKHPP